eukprot:scaffold76788_cov47-Cyclotella_meneghiniana.AAC.3
MKPGQPRMGLKEQNGMAWPIYRRDDDTIDWRLTFSDAGSLHHRRNVENAKVSLRYGRETAFEEEIGGMHFLLGGGVPRRTRLRSRGEVPLGVRRVGNMFELVGGDAVDAARVVFVEALRLF